jgi:hypothetical protein
VNSINIFRYPTDDYVSIYNMKRDNEDDKVLFIMKRDEDIVWHSEYLETIYGIKTLVDSPHNIKCDLCGNLLSNINRYLCVCIIPFHFFRDELWRCVERCYFCVSCYEQHKLRIVEYLQRQKDKKRKMPRLLKQVHIEIENHRNFTKLEQDLRDQYDGSTYLRKLDGSKGQQRSYNNQFIRSLWYHLYHEKEMPK